MTALLFLRKRQVLMVMPGSGHLASTFDAANNVDSHSKGVWPEGTWPFVWFDPHAGDPPNSAYGSHGILLFEVTGREGMGVHAGRAGVPDGLGRSGFQHCTFGCIRTTEEAMQTILIEHALSPLSQIEVSDG